MGRTDPYPALQRDLSAFVDTTLAALVPERVMVRAVGHWSNITILGHTNARTGAIDALIKTNWEHRCGEV
jgi:hypothetical protein